MTPAPGVRGFGSAPCLGCGRPVREKSSSYCEITGPLDARWLIAKNTPPDGDECILGVHDDTPAHVLGVTHFREACLDLGARRLIAGDVDLDAIRLAALPLDVPTAEGLRRDRPSAEAR